MEDFVPAWRLGQHPAVLLHPVSVLGGPVLEIPACTTYDSE